MKGYKTVPIENHTSLDKFFSFKSFCLDKMSYNLMYDLEKLFK